MSDSKTFHCTVGMSCYLIFISLFCVQMFSADMFVSLVIDGEDAMML